MGWSSPRRTSRGDDVLSARVLYPAASVPFPRGFGHDAGMGELHFPRHEYYMRLALREAQRAAEHGDVPVGAVVVLDGEVIAAGRQRARAPQEPARARRDDRHRGGRQAHGQLAAAQHRALRHHGALPHVRRRHRAGAHPASGVRRPRREGRRRRHPLQRLPGRAPQPLPRDHQRRARRRVGGACCASSSKRGAEPPCISLHAFADPGQVDEVVAALQAQAERAPRDARRASPPTPGKTLIRAEIGAESVDDTFAGLQRSASHAADLSVVAHRLRPPDDRRRGRPRRGRARGRAGVGGGRGRGRRERRACARATWPTWSSPA